MIVANNVAPGDVRKNDDFKRVAAKRGEGNSAWLKRIISQNRFDSRGLVLLGGNSVADFHIRVAQAPLRHDLTPSYWSTVGILANAESFYSVPMQWTGELSEMPHANGIQLCKIADYNDPVHFPNIAFIQFTADMTKVIDNAKKLKWQRSFVDLPELVIRWLEYIWAVTEGNPLANAKGLPSAVFVELAYGIAGIELTPGLASSSSCPEAIWQAAKWWSQYYEDASDMKSVSRAQSMVPRGCFFMRQPAAAVYEEPYVAPPKKKTSARKK